MSVLCVCSCLSCLPPVCLLLSLSCLSPLLVCLRLIRKWCFLLLINWCFLAPVSPPTSTAEPASPPTSTAPHNLPVHSSLQALSTCCNRCFTCPKRSSIAHQLLHIKVCVLIMCCHVIVCTAHNLCARLCCWCAGAPRRLCTCSSCRHVFWSSSLILILMRGVFAVALAATPPPLLAQHIAKLFV